MHDDVYALLNIKTRRKMEIYIYSIFFIIGTLIGSFLTLAVHRIPLKQDITHERSYCPKCNHRLEFFDLIPVFSYIFLKGKCRYCKEKIRPRYFLLETLSGLIFVLFILSMNINLYYISINKIIYILLGTLYIISIILIAGIDKEYRKIQKSILGFGVFVILVYIIYLYILKINVYRYAIYLMLLLIILIINKDKEINYSLQIFLLCLYMACFVGEEGLILTTTLTLLIVGILSIIKRKKEVNITIGFYLGIVNIVILIVQNFLVGDYYTWLN